MANIDILIPCYNSSSTLLKTLNSIINQSYKNFRVILVDNCSTDGSVDIYKSIVDHRFELMRHNSHVSLGDNLNRCLNYVEADFFCIMHSDDEYLSDYLFQMISFMHNNGDVDIAHCEANIIGNDSSVIFSIKNFLKSHFSNRRHKIYFGDKGILWISKYNKITAPSVMYRKSILKNCLKFNPTLKFTLDWDFYFRALRSGLKISKLDLVLFNYRIHSKQQTSILIASMEKYYEISSILNEINTYLKSKNINHKMSFNLFFYLTILSDMANNILRLKFSECCMKFNFLFKTIISNLRFGK